MDVQIPVRTATPFLDRVSSPRDMRAMTDDELCALAIELRQETIRNVSVTGGHLGSSLGVIELTVAVHAVFDTPRDTLIWDVGHQCYPHKIVTGRRDRMHTLRQEDGLSGFTKRTESRYDPFGAAHSSTAMSAGLGFAVAHHLTGRPGDVVCVVGDGAMSAGMAYEAMNNAGGMGKRLFVILNDNDMSIAPPAGALAHHLRRLGDLPARDLGTAEAAENLFEQLGFDYAGPVDGHDLPALLAVLRAARREAEGPVLIHARTVKGKGYPPAERAADKCHGVSKFNIVTGEQKKAKPKAPSYTGVFSTALMREAERDPAVVGITAAMPSGTGISGFAKAFPDRSFDVGIAEQHAVTFAAGLAAAGMKPFCAIYSTFLQRAYDQIVHDVALQGLPVRFAIDRAGLVGADGATHAGSFDIGYLGSLPGFVVMAPSDEAELVHAVATAVAYDDGPCAFRYPRGEGSGVALPDRGVPFAIGKGRVVKQGAQIALLSLGTRLAESLEAADMLDAMGLSTTVADARFAKPLDSDLLHRLASDHSVLMTIEEGAIGGFGSQVFHSLAESGLLDSGLKVRSMILPDRFIDQATPQAMYDAAELNARHIVDAVTKCLRFEDRSLSFQKPRLQLGT